jgi:hypothetical protein
MTPLDGRNDGGKREGNGNPAGRNQRNVWHLATEPFPEAHFATFPSEIPRRCIKAGTSEKGQCPACGAPWVRVVERDTNWQERKQNGAWAGNVGVAENYQNNVHGQGMSHDLYSNAKTTGWQPGCSCNAGEPVPQTVLDLFSGSGTTGVVCIQLGRDYIGVELSPEYAEMSRTRLNSVSPLFAQADVVPASCDTTDKDLSSSLAHSPLPLFEIPEKV